MVQVEEVINLIISSIFIIYLVFLIRWQRNSLRTFWFGGVVFMFSSQVFTIVEGFWLPYAFDVLEHLSFATAAVLFLISVLRREIF